MGSEDIHEPRISTSRLQCLRKRDLINGTAAALELALSDLGEEIEKDWTEKWQPEKQDQKAAGG